MANYFAYIRRYCLELNLFNDEAADTHNIQKERLATRIYIISLLTVLIAAAIIAASTLQTLNKTDYLPSQSTFKRLVHHYPDTLKCPCTRLSIPYETFVNTHAKFHQVCSSKFVEQSWIDSIYIDQNITSASTSDMRITLSAFWQTISDFCRISNQTWIDLLNDFAKSTLFSPIAIEENLARIQSRAALNSSLSRTIAILVRSLLSTQYSIKGNQLISGMASNFYVKNIFSNLTLKSYPLIVPKIFNNCSCLNMNGCRRSFLVNNSQEQLVNIPGLVSDCLLVDATLASTLECYYDSTCLSLLHGQLSRSIEPLSINLSNHFLHNTTIQMLLNELMIEEMTSEISFDSFYTQCNPAYCSYIYSHRMDLLFIVTTIIGIFGGLSAVLYFIAPFIAQFIINRQNKHLPQIDSLPPTQPFIRRYWVIIINYCRRLPGIVREQLISLNLFKSHVPPNPENLLCELVATRLFIACLIILIVAFGFYAFLSVPTQIVTIHEPSLTTYEKLYNEHSRTLQCPCSKLSISHETFVNISFIPHQICSSQLVSPAWLDYLALFDVTSTISNVSQTSKAKIDFRLIGASYFQLLAMLCSLSKTFIEDSQRVFSTEQFINDRVMASSLFNQQIQVLVNSFTTSTTQDFSTMFYWTLYVIQTSQLVTSTNINSYISVNNDKSVSFKSALLANRVTITDEDVSVEGSCQCKRQAQGCFSLPIVYLTGSNYLRFEHVINRLVGGCYPYDGMYLSGTRWWYNKTITDLIIATYNEVIHSQTLSTVIKPLDEDVPSHFIENSVKDLMVEMFVETWISNTSHFDLFYSQCAPLYCSFTIEERRDIITALLLLIAICGGLNRGLQLLVPLLVKFVFLIIRKWRNRGPFQSLSATCNRFKYFPNKIVQCFKTLNFFESISTDAATVDKERLYTRIYIILLTIFLSVVVIYTSLVERTIVETYPAPSYLDYERLLILYPRTLRCSCTQISIPYKTFVTQLNVDSFHPICTSEFGLGRWIEYLGVSYLNISLPEWLMEKDFRIWSANFFDGLQRSCGLVTISLPNNIDTFLSMSYVSDQVIPRDQFNIKINEHLLDFQTSVPARFDQTFELSRTTIQGNALMTMYSTNWKIGFDGTNQNMNASFYTSPVTYKMINENNKTCSCATSKFCSMPAQLFDSTSKPMYTIEGLVLGCVTMESILQSSLSCFYSTECFRTLLWFMPRGDRPFLFEPWITTLDRWPVLNDSSSRFKPNDTLETIIRAAFIDTWISNISYEMFFDACAPSQCSFSYQYRFEFLAVSSAFLSVYGGLSMALKFIIPRLIQILEKIRNRLRVRPSP